MTLALALIAYYTLHSLLAAEKVKAFLHSRFIPLRWYRILYNLFAIALLLPIGWLYLQADKEFLFSTPPIIRGIAFLGLMVGIVLLVMALGQYDLSEFSGVSHLQKRKSLQDKDTLITTGLNSWVRHPLYFASLLLWWSYFFAFPSRPFLAIAIISTLYLYVGILLEERKLVVVFGESYKQYQKEVSMLLPIKKATETKKAKLED